MVGDDVTEGNTLEGKKRNFWMERSQIPTSQIRKPWESKEVSMLLDPASSTHLQKCMLAKKRAHLNRGFLLVYNKQSCFDR